MIIFLVEASVDSVMNSEDRCTSTINALYRVLFQLRNDIGLNIFGRKCVGTVLESCSKMQSITKLIVFGMHSIFRLLKEVKFYLH